MHESYVRLQALQNGETEMIYSGRCLSCGDYDQALMPLNIEGGISESASQTRNLILNASELLLELKIREAIAHAIDKQTLSDGLT